MYDDDDDDDDDDEDEDEDDDDDDDDEDDDDGDGDDGETSFQKRQYHLLGHICDVKSKLVVTTLIMAFLCLWVEG